MKKTFKIIGLTILLVFAMILFIIGPLYCLPIENGDPITKDYLGNIILGYLGLNLSENTQVYFISISCTLCGAATASWIFLFIAFIKNERKSHIFKNKAKEVPTVKDSIKIKTPKPESGKKVVEDPGHNHNNINF